MPVVSVEDSLLLDTRQRAREFSALDSWTGFMYGLFLVEPADSKANIDFFVCGSGASCFEERLLAEGGRGENGNMVTKRYIVPG